MFLLKTIKACFTPLFLKGPWYLINFLIHEAFGPPEYEKKHLKINLIHQTPLKMTKYFNFPCQTEMVWMFKNIYKNIKPYKFSNAKNIELLVYFYKKILRTWKMLKFQKLKGIANRTWILLVLIKKECRLCVLDNIASILAYQIAFCHSNDCK